TLLAHHGSDEKRSERKLDTAQRLAERGGDALDDLASGDDVLPCQHDRLATRLGYRGRERAPGDEVVDVHRMVLIRAAADDRHDAAVDEPKELREPTVARAVRFGDPHDRPAEPFPAPRDLPLGLELRHAVDVLGTRRRRLVESSVARGSVHANRAAVHEASDAG